MGEIIKRPAFIHNANKKLFDNLRDDFLTDFVLSDWLPSVDVKELPTSFLIKLDVPGVNLCDIIITTEQYKLHISGHKESDSETQLGYLQYERVKGSFQRTLIFSSLLSSIMKCQLINGVLEILIDKLVK